MWQVREQGLKENRAIFSPASVAELEIGGKLWFSSRAARAEPPLVRAGLCPGP